MSEHELAALGLGNVRAADAADLERAVLQEVKEHFVMMCMLWLW
jgi:hypothetical protein